MKHAMQDKLAEAAHLFRENDMLFGDVRQDKEKANLYRGLAALAEGLMELKEELSRRNNETKDQLTTGRHPASVRRR